MDRPFTWSSDMTVDPSFISNSSSGVGGAIFSTMSALNTSAAPSTRNAPASLYCRSV